MYVLHLAPGLGQKLPVILMDCFICMWVPRQAFARKPLGQFLTSLPATLLKSTPLPPLSIPKLLAALCTLYVVVGVRTNAEPSCWSAQNGGVMYLLLCVLCSPPLLERSSTS